MHHKVGLVARQRRLHRGGIQPWCTASRSPTDRSRRTPRLSQRRAAWRPPPPHIHAIRLKLSPWEPDTTCCCGSELAAIFTQTGLSHWCKPSTPAATLPSAIANA